MVGSVRHEEVAELLGAFALDAVDGDEAALVQAHLESCPRCRDEVAQHREVAALLAFGGASAPDGLWDRIAGSLEETPPELDMSRIVPLGARRAPRSVRLRTVAALVAVAAAVITALGIEVGRLDHRYGALNTAVAKQDVDRTILRAATDPDARELALRSFDGKLAVKAFVNPRADSVVDYRNLPALPSDQEYQLWALEGQAKVSVRLLGRQPGVVTFRSGAKVQALAITAEQAGGVTASDKPAVVAGYL